jgi:hypothetical protein
MNFDTNKTMVEQLRAIADQIEADPDHYGITYSLDNGLPPITIKDVKSIVGRNPKITIEITYFSPIETVRNL